METALHSLQEGTSTSGRDSDVTLHVEGPPQCSAVNDILSRVGDKWSVRVVLSLAQGSRRFGQLRREIDGISQRMLTRTLRNLERDGLVERTVTPSVPLRVDYELTVLGRSLCKPIALLGDWAITNMGRIEAARAAYDEREDQTKL